MIHTAGTSGNQNKYTYLGKIFDQLHHRLYMHGLKIGKLIKVSLRCINFHYKYTLLLFIDFHFTFDKIAHGFGLKKILLDE
jgi:hypothetical protein